MEITTIPDQPFGSVTSSNVNKYVEQFQQFARTTAEAIIEMGSVVHTAKQNLNKTEFTQFCTGIRYEDDSSAIRKLEQIGIKANTLRTHANQLPNTWTTIYQLTQLTDDVLEQAIDSGKVHLTMTGGEARKLVEMSNGSKTTAKKINSQSNVKTDSTPVDSQGYALKVVFMMTPSRADATRLEEMIQQLIDDQGFGCSVIRSPSLDTYLNNVTES